MSRSIQEMFDHERMRNELQVRAAEVWMRCFDITRVSWSDQLPPDVIRKTDDLFAAAINSLDRYWASQKTETK